MDTSFDINTIVNYLFIGAIGWIRSLEVRLRNIPQQTIITVESYTGKMSHRIDRLEDRMNAVLSQNENKSKVTND